jgi:hypothetical protein
MPNSLNVRFSGDAVPDAEFDRPLGASIARLLRTGLAQCGWETSDIDIWRDGGWIFSCIREESKLDVVLVKIALEREWVACVAPTHSHLLLGWLFGMKASAPPEVVFALATDVHSILSRQGSFADFKWCWDGFPEDGASTPEPVSAVCESPETGAMGKPRATPWGQGDLVDRKPCKGVTRHRNAAIVSERSGPSDLQHEALGRQFAQANNSVLTGSKPRGGAMGKPRATPWGRDGVNRIKP